MVVPDIIIVKYTPKPYSNYHGPYTLNPYSRPYRTFKEPFKGATRPYSNYEGLYTMNLGGKGAGSDPTVPLGRVLRLSISKRGA